MKFSAAPSSRIVHLVAPIFTGPAPTGVQASVPQEFLIWAYGDIPTEKGVFKLTKAGAKTLMEKAHRWGNEFPIDWDHAMVSGQPLDPAESGKAAGWFTPELRDNGLWATKIKWTSLALKKLSTVDERGNPCAAEYRYFSPAFTHLADGTITGLTNIALTNLPATRDQDPLVASRNRRHKESHMDPELLKFLQQMQATLDARLDKMEAETKRKLKRLAQADDDDDEDDDEDDDDAPPKKKSAKTSKKAKCAKCGSSMKCSKCEGGVTTSLTSEQLDEIDDESLEAKRAFKASLLGFTGKESTSESLGVLMGWKAAAEKNVALEMELAQLRGKVAGGAVEAVIAKYEKLGKVTPAMRPKCIELGNKDIKMLEGYLSVAPVVAPIGKRTTRNDKTEGGAGTGENEPPPNHDGSSAELTAEDRHVAALLGNTDLKALAARKGEIGAIDHPGAQSE